MLLLSARRLVRLGAVGWGFGKRLVARGLGLGYGCWGGVSIIVVRCIKVAKKGILQRRGGWLSGVWLGVVEWWSWVRILLGCLCFFFFLPLEKIFQVFWRANYRYSKRKISGNGTLATAYDNSCALIVFAYTFTVESRKYAPPALLAQFLHG